MPGVSVQDATVADASVSDAAVSHASNASVSATSVLYASDATASDASVSAYLQMQTNHPEYRTTTAGTLVPDMVSEKCIPSQQLQEQTLFVSNLEQAQVVPVHACDRQMHGLSDQDESA